MTINAVEAPVSPNSEAFKSRNYEPTYQLKIDTEHPAQDRVTDAALEVAFEKPGLALASLVDDLIDKYPDHVAMDPEDGSALIGFYDKGKHVATHITRSAPDQDGNRKLVLNARDKDRHDTMISVNTGRPDEYRYSVGDASQDKEGAMRIILENIEVSTSREEQKRKERLVRMQAKRSRMATIATQAVGLRNPQ